MQPTLRSSSLLDRQSQRRNDVSYIAALAERGDARWLLLIDAKPVICSSETRSEAAIRWFTRAEIEQLGIPMADALFLGVERASGAGRFALASTEHTTRSHPLALGMLRPAVDLRSLAAQGAMSSEELSLLGQAKALVHWHDHVRCCGHCGGATRIKDGGWRRKCWACGLEHFPRTDPVVIMLIVHPEGDSCLLGRSGRFQAKMFSALAGFVEPGEDIEDAVRRETLEEAGVEVGEVSYHSSQPWSFPHSLMIGCIGQATTSDITFDPEELVEARWFPREEARLMITGKHPDGLFGPGPQAIARVLISSFVEG